MTLPLSDHAIYTPAISSAYAKYGYGQVFKGSYSFEESDLNFLAPDCGLFNYPYSLYSAGQAAKTDGTAQQITFVSKSMRDIRNTCIIGDSGGYQVQQDTIKFNGDETCERILRWLEDTADYSMTLDFPTGSIGKGAMEKHRERLIAAGHNIAAVSAQNGQSLDFNACLKQSQLNLDYFVANRKLGATKFLNVLQGRNEAESKAWYEAVKGYSLEGWAFAGLQQCQFSMVLNRLLDMWQDELLQRAEWIHFLGISTFPAAYLFTTILRGIRQINPGISVSFDTSNAFTTAVNGAFYGSARQDKHISAPKLYTLAENAPADDITLNELCVRLALAERVSDEQLTPWNSIFVAPANTQIGARAKMSDLLLPSNGNEARRMSPDGAALLMNHNADFLLRCFRRLNTNIDSRSVDDFVPATTFIAKSCIEQVLESAFVRKNVVLARDQISRMRPHLDRMAVERFQ